MVFLTKFLNCLLFVSLIINFTSSTNSSIPQNVVENDVQPTTKSQALVTTPKSSLVTQKQSVKIKPSKKPEVKVKQTKVEGTLADSEECAEDVLRLCSKRRPKNDFSLIACLSDGAAKGHVSDSCNQLVWEYKLNITTDRRLDNRVLQQCKNIMPDYSKCQTYLPGSGKLVPCLLNYLDEISLKNLQCASYLREFAGLIYADYRLICNFMDDCKDDIKKYECGKVQTGDYRDMHTTSHSQGQVIACLEEKLASSKIVSHTCVKQIYRLLELQADDFNMDRHLYLSCKDDRELLCETVVAGDGAVYECLFRHKFDEHMSNECREAITLRQKLISQDYMASFRVHQSCYQDINNYRCMKRVEKGVNDHQDHVGLSTILLCLEDEQLKGNVINGKCLGVLNGFRKQLLEDFEISPEIVHNCALVISDHCNGGIKKQGETLHCIMQTVHEKPGTASEQCEAAVMTLLKETDVENQFQLDLSLTSSCMPVIKSICRASNPSDFGVLSCLLDHIHSSKMVPECEQKLVDIQYFVGRNFFIDKRFNMACRDDAMKFCFQDMVDIERNNDEVDRQMPVGLVLSCLNRYTSAYHHENKGKSVARKCEEQVKRVLRGRALDYQLNPSLEESCRSELGRFCSVTQPAKGEELKCLQDNYGEIAVGSDCQLSIQELTRLESESVVDVEGVLVKECEKMLKQFCAELLEDNDEGKVMECLINNKNNMESEKCAAGVEHFQLIEMKDYQFDFKFMKNCRSDAKKLCLKQSQTMGKPEIVRCLSEIIRDDVIKEVKSRVSEDCRSQVKVEKLQLHENIRFDPMVSKKCLKDVEMFCSEVSAGHARVIDCLRKHKSNLTKDCRKEIFRIQKEEVDNPSLDFKLMKICKHDLRLRCLSELKRNDASLILDCLISHKSSLEKRCHHLVVEREIESFDDVNLNPDLMNSCSYEIKHHCEKEFEKLKDLEILGEDPTGGVYSCLKKAFSSKKEMSDQCRRHVLFVIRQQADNLFLNPKLTLDCIEPIQKFCGQNTEVECLKQAYYEGKLNSYRACLREVANVLMESRSDVNADPELAEACGNDVIKFCRNVVEGNGRKIKCLLDLNDQDSSILMPDCHEQLLLRKRMWAVSDRQIENLNDVVDLVSSSEHASFFYSIFCILILVVLFMGLICGRASGRHYKMLKNR